jgi:type III pantothenate kinase
MGYCEMIDGLIDRTENELGYGLHTVTTGGLGSLFLGKLRHAHAYRSELTLVGIKLLHDRIVDTKNTEK